MIHRACFVFLLVSIAACDRAPDVGPREPAVWPTESWSRTTPEAQGMRSVLLAEMLDEIASSDRAMHSLLLVRHGAIVLDARFHPYDGARAHDLASCTKSLTSLAVGLAIHEGHIDGTGAPLLSYFQSEPSGDPRRDAITIENALTMTAGIECINEPTELTLLAMQESSDWIDFALALPMVSEPGTVFDYCSSVSHLLSGAVSRATGMPADAYLRERLLAPIGAGAIEWPHDPQGVAHGWGDARLAPEDMARIGLLLLHRGRWDGAEIASEEYLRAATSDRIATLGADARYGYQWWATEDGSFYAAGRGGQYIFVNPALDLIVVTTGSAAPEQAAAYATLLDDHLVPAIVSPDEIEADPNGVSRLDEAISRALAPPAPIAAGPLPAIAEEISGRRFALESNLFGWSAITLYFGSDDEASWTIELEGGAHTFAIGMDAVPRIARGGDFASIARYRGIDVALEGRFLDASSFEVEFDTIDTIDAGTVTFTFEGDEVAIDVYERTLLRSHIALAGNAR
jgi:CubicO group peptidase (beta-lactamase class C family)